MTDPAKTVHTELGRLKVTDIHDKFKKFRVLPSLLNRERVMWDNTTQRPWGHVTSSWQLPDYHTFHQTSEFVDEIKRRRELGLIKLLVLMERSAREIVAKYKHVRLVLLDKFWLCETVVKDQAWLDASYCFLADGEYVNSSFHDRFLGKLEAVSA